MLIAVYLQNHAFPNFRKAAPHVGKTPANEINFMLLKFADTFVL